MLLTVAWHATACSGSDDGPTQDPPETNTQLPQTTGLLLPQFAPYGGYDGGTAEGAADFRLTRTGCLKWDGQIAMFPEGTVANGDGTLTMPGGEALQWMSTPRVEYYPLRRVEDPDLIEELRPCETKGKSEPGVVLVLGLD